MGDLMTPSRRFVETRAGLELAEDRCAEIQRDLIWR
jgi:hypothetical protein